MIGWILAGMVATAGVALYGERNKDTNMVVVKCPYCSRNISVELTNDLKEYVCPGCNTKFKAQGTSAYRVEDDVKNITVNSSNTTQKVLEEDKEYNIQKEINEACPNGVVDKYKMRDVMTKILFNRNLNPDSKMVYKDIDYGINMLWRHDVPVWILKNQNEIMYHDIYMNDGGKLEHYSSLLIFTDEKFISEEMRNNKTEMGFKEIVDVLSVDYVNYFQMVSFNPTKIKTYEFTMSKDLVLRLARQGGNEFLTI